MASRRRKRNLDGEALLAWIFAQCESMQGEQDTRCMVWTRGRTYAAKEFRDTWWYGKMRYKGDSWRVHRLVWKLLFDEEPECIEHRDDKCVCGGCVNPEHLLPSTWADNNRTMARNRGNRRQ